MLSLFKKKKKNFIFKSQVCFGETCILIFFEGVNKKMSNKHFPYQLTTKYYKVYE